MLLVCSSLLSFFLPFFLFSRLSVFFPLFVRVVSCFSLQLLVCEMRLSLSFYLLILALCYVMLWYGMLCIYTLSISASAVSAACQCVSCLKLYPSCTYYGRQRSVNEAGTCRLIGRRLRIDSPSLPFLCPLRTPHQNVCACYFVLRHTGSMHLLYLSLMNLRA